MQRHLGSFASKAGEKSGPMAYRSQQEFENETRIPDFEAKLIQMVRHEAQNAGLLG